MNDRRGFDRAVDRWLDDGSDATPPEVIDAVLLAARSTPQERDLRFPWRIFPSKRLPHAVAVVAVLTLSVTVLSALRPPPPEEPSVDLGIFEPVVGRIVYWAGGSSLFAVDPSAPADHPTRVQLTSGWGIPMGWSSDGARLLIVRGSGATERLFVLHADGTETQVTERPMSIQGAAISPDGSRVVFAGGSGEFPGDPGSCCAEGFSLYAVDADGGPAQMLREASVADVTFSPDGKQIAYVDWGGGDHSHNVWLMDADGSDAHEIAANETTLGAGHVRGLAWSPAGDRIALGLEGSIYTFAPDGSGFRRVIAKGNRPYWSPDGSQIAYTISCLQFINGCGLAIADADGSNVLTFASGASGPWHPGTNQ